MYNKQEKGYHKLILWKELKALLSLTYDLTNRLPKSEDFGLKSQMRRALVSVISNFVEGYLKSSKKEKIRFMEISQTSSMELEGQSEICQMLEYWSEEEYTKFDKQRASASYLLHQYKSAIY
jgi:four helix bundle protein